MADDRVAAMIADAVEISRLRAAAGRPGATVRERVVFVAAVWARGCSCAAEGRPWECEECTDAMVAAMLRTANGKPLAAP